MVLLELKEILPPPSFPHETGIAQNWDQIYEKIGIRLPADYQAFISTYGTGIVGGFIRIWNPFSENATLNFISMMNAQLQTLKQIKAEYPDDVPFPIYPQENGLIAFGDTINGDSFYWLASSQDPDEWSLVVNQARSATYDIYFLSLTEFLINLLRGKLEPANDAYEIPLDKTKGFRVLS